MQYLHVFVGGSVFNSMINHPVIERIPLGILNKLREPKDLTRINRVYVNFETNIPEREFMMEHLKANPSEFVLIEQKVDIDQYYDNMERSKYILCPPGNAFDTYRRLEAIYMGSIPLVWDSRMSRGFEYPHIRITGLNDLTSENLSEKVITCLEIWTKLDYHIGGRELREH